MKNNIKLIIVDLYGVMSTGSYKDTCKWIAKKYHLDFKEVYEIVYFKYFTPATLGKMTEAQSFQRAVLELGIQEDWKKIRQLHLGFLKLNKPVFKLVKKLQANGHKILLLSKNTPPQFNWSVKNMGLKKTFKHIVNTFYLGLPKSSPKTMKWVCKKFKVRPQEILFCDDQAFNLVAAKKMGVKTILYKNFSQFTKEIKKYLS